MIYLWLDGVPPSANHAYINMKHGRTLSKEGKKYIAETKTGLVERFGKELRIFKPDKPYLIFFRFFFPAVENAGWFTGNAETRYKRIDVTNRVKLLEDCLKSAGGIDDSQHIRVVLDKQQGKERTDIWVWDLEEEETPFDAGFNNF